MGPINFAYAQLRDQGLKVIANTRTDITGSYLTVLPLTVSSVNGTITGRLRLVPGFAANHPSVGTVYVEIFGTNVTGHRISLGLSNAINLTSNQADLKAYNNIFNPARGEKTTVRCAVQSAGHVTIKLYTLSGTLVSTLFDGDLQARTEKSVDWFGDNVAGNRVASGIYLVHMTGPGISKTQKIVVVK